MTDKKEEIIFDKEAYRELKAELRRVTSRADSVSILIKGYENKVKDLKERLDKATARQSEKAGILSIERDELKSKIEEINNKIDRL